MQPISDYDILVASFRAAEIYTVNTSHVVYVIRSAEAPGSG